MIRRNKKKVIAALSGGVDSAVAAALLKKQGFDVTGVFFDLGNGSRAGLKNAKKIAGKLDIPLKVVNARKNFEKKIIDYFVDAYRRGLTPNPCVFCNREIKFRLLLNLLKKEKADYAATGHYARLRRKFKTQNSKLKIKEGLFFRLLEAKDKSKDQSYFLYRLIQKDLSRIIFPLGDLKKAEVKKIAKKLGLPVAREESQDVCFLLGRDINSFLGKRIKTTLGNIVDEAGKILGRHGGLPFYTLGQRKGIKIGGTGPYWVIRKNVGKNELLVSRNPKKLLANKFFVHKVNWIGKGAKPPLKVQVRIRYRADKIPAIIKKKRNGKWEVRSKKPLRAVTPGQSAVFYRKNEVLGGGIIL